MIKTINNLTAQHYNELINGGTEEVTRARQYLYNRGINDNDIKHWQIGYSLNDWNDVINKLSAMGYSRSDIISSGITSESSIGTIFDRFRARIMFPIKNIDGDVVGFTGRKFNNAIDESMKYLNSPETEVFHKKEAIFGIEKAILSVKQKKCFIIMEGQFDVITAHKYGVTNAVACSGSVLTEEQVSIMRQYTKNLVLCFDGDNAGRKATIRSLVEHYGKINMDVIELPDGKDPDELLRNNHEYFSNIYATKGHDYLIKDFFKSKKSDNLYEVFKKINKKSQEFFVEKIKIMAKDNI